MWDKKSKGWENSKKKKLFYKKNLYQILYQNDIKNQNDEIKSKNSLIKSKNDEIKSKIGRQKIQNDEIKFQNGR